MFSFLYNTIFYQPIYNLLILGSAILPTHDVGLSIVLVTVLLRVITFPIMHRAVVVQRKMKELEPHIQNIREQHKNNTQEQGVKIMALYKEHGVNPFSGFASLFIQIPVIYALYQVVQDIAIVPALLYSITPVPPMLNTMFLGIVDITQSSVVLAVAAGLFQFLQANMRCRMSSPAETKSSFHRLYAHAAIQTKYFPVIVFIGYSLLAAVSLYWAANRPRAAQ